MFYKFFSSNIINCKRVFDPILLYKNSKDFGNAIINEDIIIL